MKRDARPRCGMGVKLDFSTRPVKVGRCGVLAVDYLQSPYLSIRTFEPERGWACRRHRASALRHGWTPVLSKEELRTVLRPKKGIE